MAFSTHWATHRSARLTAGGLLVVAASILPSAESAAQARPSETVLGYLCQFPSGSQAVTVVVSGTFADEATPGEPVETGDVTVGLDLPPEVTRTLEQAGATEVSARAHLSVVYAAGTDSAEADWSGLTAPAQDITGEEDVSLVAGGPVPTATFGSPGTATVTASDLSFRLDPSKPDGTPAVPSGIDVSCAVQGGQNAVLASLTVSGPTTDETGPPPSAEPDPDDLFPEEPRSEPTEEAPREPARTQADEGPEPCPSPPFGLNIPADTYATGYTNVKKLGGAALLGPAHTNVTMMTSYVNDNCLNTVQVGSTAEFGHEGKRQLPPAQGTFLTFGFMPTTATIVLEQVGPTAAIDSVALNDLEKYPSYPEYTTISATFALRVKDVQVNGVALDVGPDCHTAQPIKQVLHAYGTTYPAEGYTVQRGGTMDGTTYIPPFEGCGVGEDLDPLLTASISGGGNYIKMTQAPLCLPSNPESPCPPEKPRPER
ncbi:DUF6801 domain-containing protein [Streptomyces sp. NPDC058330]|uniref:DUF6801 domain-containing protein n=1 Tax=Streptomyces sp. NPDC058330 TaxID=3346449 RepID=UPI0036E3C17C